MVYVMGNDVSHWNFTNIRLKLQAEWDKGHRFLYIKVSEGTGWEDINWKQIHAIAFGIGFKVGAYHWFSHRLNGTAQAGWFYSLTKDHIWHLPPMLDVEENGTVSKATYAARVRACLNEIEELWAKAIVYTSKSKWDAYVDAYVDNDLFVAHYTTRPNPLVPRQWENRGWTLWQYKTVPLDTDRYNGDWISFLKWIGDEEPVGDLEERVLELEAAVLELEEQQRKFVAWIEGYE